MKDPHFVTDENNYTAHECRPFEIYAVRKEAWDKQLQLTPNIVDNFYELTKEQCDKMGLSRSNYAMDFIVTNVMYVENASKFNFDEWYNKSRNYAWNLEVTL